MSLIGTIRRFRWPYTDLRGGRTRPALVLSEPDDRADVEVAMITSSARHHRTLPIRESHFDFGRLPKDSFVRVDRILKIRLEITEALDVRVTRDFVGQVRRAVICGDTRAFSALAHVSNRPGNDPLRKESETSSFTLPSSSFPPVPYAARVFTEDEVEAAVSATLDFWLTLGPEGAAFENELAAFLGVKHSLLVNSGSSANLVAISALTTHKLPDHKRIKPGDEVITVAAGFPTTVAPIVQVRAVPVFIDAIPETGNADCSMLEAAYSPGKTKAVMMAHALGNPFDLGAVLEFCKKYDLWLIEDNCDALGCTYAMPVERARALGLDHLLRLAIDKSEKPEDAPVSAFSFQPSAFPRIQDGVLTAYTGSFGDISTQSFYPPHHLTMGEGGAVNIIRRASLKTYAESFRDWGRDCWCPSGKDNTCNKRFGWQLGELPEGYDHKYIYSHLGYNLKPLDPQAAIGRVQLRRLPDFIEARKRNWEYLRRGLAGMEDVFDFTIPTHATGWEKAKSEKRKEETVSAFRFPLSAFSWDSTGCQTDCSWFGFMIRVKPGAPFTRTDLARRLDEKKIGNRMLFGGNLVRQPAFVQLRKDNPDAFRVVGGGKVESGKRKEETRKEETRKENQEPRTKNALEERNQEQQSSSLPGADAIMNSSIFLGTYPGLTTAQLDYMVATVRDFVSEHQKIAV